MSNIFVSIPVMDKPELRMMLSFSHTVATCKKHKIRYFFNEGDSLISRIRNHHISAFYYDYPECEYFVSIDSDIEIVNCTSTDNLFEKLTSHNLPFVGGLYLQKRPEIRMCASSPLSRQTEMKYNSGLLEMRILAPGCWCLHRSLIKKMIEAYPQLEYEDVEYNMPKVNGLYTPYICKDEMSKQNKNKYMGEDVAFCQRWRDIGGKIYADTSIVLRHVGKMPYSMWDV